MQRVMEVTDVKLSINKSSPPQLALYAEGKVPTSGWSNPTLSPVVYVTTPADLIQDFEFCAQEPAGPVLEIVSPIAATLIAEMDVANYWGQGKPLKGVRIHARLNSIEAVLDGKTLAPDPVPWPWQHLIASAAAGSTDDLISHPLRVYHEGDFITQDHVPERVNIELKRGTQIIKRIWRG